MDYGSFILNKQYRVKGEGIKPSFLPDYLFDFQKYIVEKSLVNGRFADFADCGMGKTIMQLVWAENIVRHTNKPVLVLSPLSISHQTVREAEKFGLEAVNSRDGKIKKGIITANYERLEKFDFSVFGGVVCDESSIIKNAKGQIRNALTSAMKTVPYRLLCTATAAPNDFIELGTSSELLGYLGYVDMLSHFFKNDEDTISPAFYGSKWRFKHHAEVPFWKWLSTWALACRKPSDLGFKDGEFVLPELIEEDHIIKTERKKGVLRNPPVKGWRETREDTKETIKERCDKAAELLQKEQCGIAWCNYNSESEYLNSILKDGVEVTGSDSDEKKEEIFQDFQKGVVKYLITKPKIAGFGMNWQHCSTMTYFTDYSYEKKYQSVRRCYRFGQEKEVTVHNITTDRQRHILERVKQKEADCVRMFEEIIQYMESKYFHKQNRINSTIELPKWI